MTIRTTAMRKYGYEEVAPLPDIEVVGAHHLCQTQRNAELRKLGRLDAEAAYLYPRQRTLDVVGQERCDQQQSDEAYIYNV